MKHICHTLLIVIAQCAGIQKAYCQMTFGNEWIRPEQTYLRIPVSKTGFYRISASELTVAGISPDSINSATLQLFRRGKEVSMEVKNDNFNILGSKGYIDFYGQKNDGNADSLLYISREAMPHPYYSLYSDTASYFLTWGAHSVTGKRIKTAATKVSTDTLFYHIERSLQLYNTFYSAGNFYPPGSSFDTGIALSTYDTGEGWTGKEIKHDIPATFSISTENPFRENFSNSYAEVTIVGRSAGRHEIEIRSTVPAKKPHSFSLADYQALTIKIPLESEDLDATDKLQISVAVLNNTGSVSVSAIDWNYAQKTILLKITSQKEFAFDSSMQDKIWKFSGQVDVRFFDCTDPYAPEEMPIGDSGPAIYKTSKVIAVKNNLKAEGLRIVRFPGIDSTTDYLLISHPIVREFAATDPVAAYAAYRSSPAGGSYNPLILNIQEIYDRFNYGDPGPAGIRNAIKWLNMNEKLRFVFLVGKSIDPQTARKQKSPRTADMIPNAGWPGSDLSLAMEPGQTADSYIPSVAIGRINAENAEQVRIYLQKVKDFEAEPKAARWRKNMLHLSGGRSEEELLLFREYVKGFEEKLKNSSLGASVTTISKKTDDPVEQFPLDIPVNQGASLMTLFGHSEINVTDLDIGYASDPQRNYHNGPMYPAVIVNGCATGSIFYVPNTISSDWIFAPKSGAILFLAHTFNGVSTSLQRYTESIYEVIADTAFTSKPFGAIQREAIRRNLSKSQSVSDLANIQQMNLHGDPGIRIFPATLSDYTTDLSQFNFSVINGSTNTSLSDSIEVQITIQNNGRVKTPNCILHFTREKEDNSVEISRYQLPVIANSQTFHFRFQNKSGASGHERWRFELDPENVISEEDESNNVVTKDVIVPEHGAIPLLPKTGYTTNINEIELVAQAPYGTDSAAIIFEWDKSPNFTTSFKARILTQNRIARQKITAQKNLATKLYWRVFLEADSLRPSKTRNFSYDPETDDGGVLPEVVVLADASNPIEIEEGEVFNAKFVLQNIAGIGFKDSVFIRTMHAGTLKTTGIITKIAPLKAYEIRTLVSEFASLGHIGDQQVSLYFNDNQLPEEIYTNNTATSNYTVYPDLLPPILTVSLDNKYLTDNDLADKKPLIEIQIKDENKWMIRSDTVGIEVRIRETCATCPEQRMSLRSAQTKTLPANNFHLYLKPEIALKNGQYLLTVKATDLSNNAVKPYKIRFRVQDGNDVVDTGVAPNPSRFWFRFYLEKGGQNPGKWQILVTDLAGRFVKKIEETVLPGKNEAFWQPVNLPSGVYIYRMSLTPNEGSANRTIKEGKLVWMP